MEFRGYIKRGVRMNKEKDFFKTCFDIVKGLEVENESEAIAKVVVLNEIENLQQENKQLQEELKEYKNPIKYFKYANKNVTEENKQLKDKIPYIIQNNSCKYISIEKCKNKVCVNYKMQEMERK